MSDKQFAIQNVVAGIPPGRVASYGQIAARAGLPGRARLVGQTLREAPDELALPWHRVLRSDGRIAFEPGSSQYLSQVERLTLEGVMVIAGRVNLKRYGWEANLDHLLWGPPGD